MATYRSPAGELVLASCGDRLCLCDWRQGAYHARNIERLRAAGIWDEAEEESPVIAMAAARLDEYFDGKRTVFDVPLLMEGSGFEKTVWTGIGGVGYGSTLSYSGLAESLGKASSVRAVASACGRNPISIFIPCHRITGKDGSLTGYAGGLGAKAFLLGLEKRGISG